LVSSSINHGAFPQHATDFSLPVSFYLYPFWITTSFGQNTQGDQSAKGSDKRPSLVLFFVFWKISRRYTTLLISFLIQKLHARHFKSLSILIFQE
jgi:hypothetical protein